VYERAVCNILRERETEREREREKEYFIWPHDVIQNVTFWICYFSFLVTAERSGILKIFYPV
jgi:hypothetical protein